MNDSLEDAELCYHERQQVLDFLLQTEFSVKFLFILILFFLFDRETDHQFPIKKDWYEDDDDELLSHVSLSLSLRGFSFLFSWNQKQEEEEKTVRLV